MRIGVDGRSLAQGAGRGVAHYTSALLAALGRGFADDEWIVVAPGAWSPPPGVEAVRAVGPRRARNAASALFGRPRLDRSAGGCDLVFAPAPAPLAVSPGVPLVLTVHDRSWEVRPGDFTPYERLWHRLARPRTLAQRAAHVITDSAAVRDELLAQWSLPADRVTAIPLAPAIAPPPRDSGRIDSAGAVSIRPEWRRAPYFLFVGALEPRKGVDVLARAYALARERGLAAGLVIAGDGRATAGLDQPGVERLGRVSDAGLPPLYAGALALVLPSRLEGFGLPPLEAAAFGVPSILSDLPPLRETLGAHGARFVEPGDAGALAAALLELERDAALRSRLAATARAAIARLSWDATAAATRAVMEQAVRR